MADAVAAPPNAQPRQGNSFLFQAAKALAIYAAVSTASTFVLGPKSPFASRIKDASPGPSSGLNTSSPSIAKQPDAIPIWQKGDQLTLSVYLSTGQLDLTNPVLPHTTFEPIAFGEDFVTQTWETSFKVPKSVQQNGTLIAEIFLAADGAPLDPRDANFDPSRLAHSRKLLSRYMPEKKIRAVKSLLSKDETAIEKQKQEEEAARPQLVLSYWSPNLTLALVNEPLMSLQYQTLTPAIAQYVQLAPGQPDADKFPDRKYFYPVVFPHDFWLMKEHMTQLNDTVEEVTLKIDFWPTSAWKFQLFSTLDASTQEAARTGQAGSAELDELKRMLTETNPLLLITTFLVSILHMVFEFLAFSSDVSHWRKKKELIGVSVRTILANCFVQLVVLLYLMDNNENTSWMILGSQGIGLLIEGWKITKAVDIAIVPSQGTTLPYKLQITDKHVLSADELKTQEYDRLAFRLVSYVTIPLLIGYTVYSLLYESHRGWYSFVITTLTSFVYMFGFVQLVPQLIINYKLKSVAHLPMKALIYKTLTTVVDDFFALYISKAALPKLITYTCTAASKCLCFIVWPASEMTSFSSCYYTSITSIESTRAGRTNTAKFLKTSRPFLKPKPKRIGNRAATMPRSQPAERCIQFFDLASKSGEPWSPNTLKTRYALNYKGLAYVEEFLSYPDVQQHHQDLGITNSSDAPWKYVCPAIKDGQTVLQNSDAIATYLEEKYPSRPLFPFPGSRALYAIVSDNVVPSFRPYLSKLILPHMEEFLDENAVPYFSQDRQQRFGKPLSQVCSAEERPQAFEDLVTEIQKLATYLEKEGGPFFAGRQAQYADIVVVSWLQFLRVIRPQDGEQLLQRVPAIKRLFDAAEDWTS